MGGGGGGGGGGGCFFVGLFGGGFFFVFCVGTSFGEGKWGQEEGRPTATSKKKQEPPKRGGNDELGKRALFLGANTEA